MKRQYLILPEVRDQASILHSRGGKFTRAAGQVTHIINEISRDSEDPFHGIPQTNSGESRIENCVKYDLSGYCRLVTVHEKNKIILLFVGNHEEEEKWLKKNKGTKFAENKLGKVEIIPMPSQGGEPEILGEAVYSKGRLCEQLSERHIDYVLNGFPRSAIQKVEILHSQSGEEAVLDIYERVQDVENASLFFDVFILLMRGKKEDAIKRIELAKGEYTPITTSPVASGETVHVIPENDPSFGILFEHFVRTADYKQWMLFMHPQQQEMVQLDFKGSGKLLGVSGSGKTCVLVKRAVRLAQKYPEEKILLVTLNRSLANLIKELVEVVAEESIGQRVQVMPFFALCQDYLHRFEPESDRLYDDVTWKSLEHIDGVWEEFYRCEYNNHEAQQLLPVHDYLIAQKINAQVYIREEFDWIRSAITPNEREKYISVDREGRSIPLSQSHRKLILDGLDAWERKMLAVGVTDYLGLATALYKYVNALDAEYRCVLVDESQDFGTTELSILRKICFEGENDIFLCGDAAQRVSTKFQSLRISGIEIHASSSRKITKNYRNSKEILEAAYMVLSSNIPEGAFWTEGFEVLDPDFSSRSGPFPLIVKADSLVHEISCAITYAQQELLHNSGWKICIAFCGFSSYEVCAFAKSKGFRALDNSAKLSDASIFFSDLEQTKGFEFDIVIVVNSSHESIPFKNSDEREALRDLTQFYVALTRAKNQLVVSYTEHPSIFLTEVSDYFMEVSWSDYIDEPDATYSVPIRIEKLREHVDFPPVLNFMTGRQFLYTEHAIGCSPLLIDKCRALITGEGRVVSQSGKRSFVEWRNLGSAYDSCIKDVKSRQAFGPEGLRVFLELCEKLHIGEEFKKHGKENVYLGRFSLPE